MMPRFYADQQPVFQPAMRLIAAITNANPAAVTTTFDHSYVTGMIVRLLVTSEYGMEQMDKLLGIITVTATDAFTIDIDSTGFDLFVVPGVIPADVADYPQVIPVGATIDALRAAVRNVLPY